MNSFELNKKLRALDHQKQLAELHRGYESGWRYDPEEVYRTAARDAQKYGSSPIARLERYYESNPPLTGADPAIAKEKRKHRQLAESFVYDDQQERLLELKDSHDPKYDAFDPTAKMSLAMYERAKRAAKELGLPTGDPNGE